MMRIPETQPVTPPLHFLGDYESSQRLEASNQSFNALKLYLANLDGTEQMAIHRDWRYRLIDFTKNLKTSRERREWLLHMLIQEHELMGLIDLVHDFNTKQLSHKSYLIDESFDVFEMGIHQIGLFLGLKTHTRLSAQS